MIRFDSQKKSETIQYDSYPVFNISKIVFSTIDTNWTNRLANANITIRIVCFDETKKIELGSYQQQLSLGSLINIYSRESILETNSFYQFPEEYIDQNIKNSKNWQLTATLNNLHLGVGEYLEVIAMDHVYIKKRVDDWEKRIEDIIALCNTWATEENLTLALGRKQKMHEGLMKTFHVPMREINSADIISNDKIIATIKPFGLWILGANGRMDILTSKANFVLIDTAKQFESPMWKLFTKENRDNGSDFNKITFLQIIK